MHPILRIEELTLKIFGLLQKGQVAKCARVCNAWFLFAIEIIWEKAEFTRTISPLFIISGSLRLDCHKKWDFLRFPSQKNWDRVFLYTSQIRYLTFTTLEPTPLTAKAKFVMLKLRHYIEGPLFPRARRFSCYATSKANVHFGSVLLSHLGPLTNLELKLSPNFIGPSSTSFYSALRSSHTTLTTLDLQCPSPPAVISWDDLCSTLRLCINLQKFQCEIRARSLPHTPGLLNSLAMIPNLKAIEGCFGGAFIDMTVPQPQDEQPFPALKILRLFRPPEEKMFSASWFPPPKFQALYILELASDIFLSLLKRLSAKNSDIQVVDVTVLGGIRTLTVHSSHIQELSQLHSLRQLAISAMWGEVLVTDEDIHHLALGLPELENIRLSDCSPEDSHRPPRPTLLSIGYFIAYCPKIGTIGLRFDTSNPPALLSPTRSSVMPFSSSVYHPSPLIIDPLHSNRGESTSIVNWLAPCCITYGRTQVQVRWFRTMDKNNWQEVDCLLQQKLSDLRHQASAA